MSNLILSLENTYLCGMKVFSATFISTVQPSLLNSGSWMIARCWLGSVLTFELPVAGNLWSVSRHVFLFMATILSFLKAQMQSDIDATQKFKYCGTGALFLTFCKNYNNHTERLAFKSVKMCTIGHFFRIFARSGCTNWDSDGIATINPSHNWQAKNMWFNPPPPQG